MEMVRICRQNCEDGTEVGTQAARQQEWKRGLLADANLHKGAFWSQTL